MHNTVRKIYRQEEVKRKSRKKETLIQVIFAVLARNRQSITLLHMIFPNVSLIIHLNYATDNKE